MSAALLFHRTAPSVLPSTRYQLKLTAATSYRALATASEPKIDPQAPGTAPSSKRGSPVFPWVVGAMFLGGGGYWVGNLSSDVNFGSINLLFWGFWMAPVLHPRGTSNQ